jgi:hypothetical protein
MDVLRACNVPRVYAAVKSGGCHGMLMQYSPLETLAAWLPTTGLASATRRSSQRYSCSCEPCKVR